MVSQFENELGKVFSHTIFAALGFLMTPLLSSLHVHLPKNCTKSVAIWLDENLPTLPWHSRAEKWESTRF
jgi:hypothetical protein